MSAMCYKWNKKSIKQHDPVNMYKSVRINQTFQRQGITYMPVGDLTQGLHLDPTELRRQAPYGLE